MLFNKLSSSVIKSGLVSKLAFSLGYKLIAAQLKLKQPRQLKSDDGCFSNEYDYTPENNAELAKRMWVEFKAWAETEDYAISSLEDIAASYVKGTGKPIVKANDEVLSLRAHISGKSIAGVKAAADKSQLIAQGRIAESVKAIVAEFKDINTYANAWYHTGSEGDIEAMEISDIIKDEWIEENYEKVVKSQVSYWERYNNWDDTELVFIDADLKLIK